MEKLTLKLLRENVLLILDTDNDMLRMSYPDGRVEFLTNRQAEWNVSTYSHSMFLYTAGKHIVVEVL